MIEFIVLILGVLLYKVYQFILPPASIPAERRAVLISGCDTGFGYNLACSLYTRNYTIYAGCLTDNAVQQLQHKLPSAHVFKLDITKQSDIDNAVELVNQYSGGVLYGLVNNAGIGLNGLIDWIDITQYYNTFNVNFFGHVAMTKSFIPLLIKQQHSRVINICSVAGFLGAPNLSAYCCSKFALEAFSDSLRREMSVYDMHVSIIEPGYMKTPILDGVNPANQQSKQLWSSLSSDKKNVWGESYYSELVSKGAGIAKYAEDAMLVDTALINAISSKYPSHRYRVGLFCNILFFPLATYAPTFITDWLIRIIDGSTIPKFITDGKQNIVES